MGFAIQSGLEFQSLRNGAGSPHLVVEDWSGPDPDGEELIAWHPRPGNPFHGRLIRSGRGYAFWASDAGWYVIDPSVPKIAVEGDLSLVSELRLFGVPCSLCAHAAGDIALHASSVEIDGKGVLFAGPSLQGKTTLAAMFAARGHRLLTEDTARVTVSAMPALYPGPSVVRLRSDVAHAIDIPKVERRAMANGRVSLLLDAHDRGRGEPVPLRAIMILRSGAEVSLTRVEPAAAARDLFALAFLLPMPTHRASNFTAIADLVSRVEVLDLQRPITIEAMDRVVQAVEDHVRS